MLPVEFNGTGTVQFDVGNTGISELPWVVDQAMTLAVVLSGGVPDAVDPLDALSGPGVAWFDWSYDTNTTTFFATQIATVPGSSRERVNIAYRVAENSFLMTAPSVSNGFTASLQAPLYAESNAGNDDLVSSRTFVSARDHGDSPISYGEASHGIDVTKDLDEGTYDRYVYLGAAVDPDSAYAATADAAGDDNNPTGGLGVNDEDGVTFPVMRAGETAEILVQATIADQEFSSARPYLNAWIDWNADGDFLDEDESIAINTTVNESGMVSIIVEVPVDAVTDQPTFSRFRFGSPVGGPAGSADYGEVEDHLVQIQISYADWASGVAWDGADADPAADPDGDSLTNQEEYLLESDPNNPDTDGDGLTDWEEHAIAGTSPLDPEDVLKVSEGPASAPDFAVRWPTVAGKRYTVRTVAYPLNGWENVPDSTYVRAAGTGGYLSYTNTDLPGSSRFFHVIVEP